MTKRGKGGHPLSSSVCPSREVSYKRRVGAPKTYIIPPPQDKAGFWGNKLRASRKGTWRRRTTPIRGKGDARR